MKKGKPVCPHDWTQFLGRMYPKEGANEPLSTHYCLQCGGFWSEEPGLWKPVVAPSFPVRRSVPYPEYLLHDCEGDKSYE